MPRKRGIECSRREQAIQTRRAAGSLDELKRSAGEVEAVRPSPPEGYASDPGRPASDQTMSL